MNLIKYGFLGILIAGGPAGAVEYNNGKYGFQLNGFGTIGVIGPDFTDPVYINDWRLRTQFNYDINSDKKIGAVFAIDELALYQNQWSRDAFLFFEDIKMGRAEIGFTDSVATKLSVGLPDVSGLRINNNPLFYKKISPGGTAITDTTIYSGRYDARINIVSGPIGDMQYGFSISPVSDNYNMSGDLALRYKKSDSKTKTAISIAASFIDSPENFQTDILSQNLTADFRAQISAGLNIQYNSWIAAATVRAIYDENALGVRPSDGMAAGLGLSYDLLKYTISASYTLSDTGIWSDAPNYIANTALVSLRYIYTENIDTWLSIGITDDVPFFSTGLRGKF